MEKNNYNFNMAVKIIEEYDRILPLTGEDYRYIYILYSYPEKFWKTANLYSNSNKARIPEKSVEKLQTAIGQQAEKERFLENIFTFHL